VPNPNFDPVLFRVVSPDQRVLELVRSIVEQNEKIIEMNQRLVELLAYPPVIVKGKEAA
jgi:hypothetical protein